uniref:fasciculation and elongation protein zeta-2 isoform X3 n=1 Tax=Monopterus albus TaxID=43700 RepID=UPI0009B48B20|nr:fasciculation and elongation protein zeta-2-like isoform X3 [Monopterus albus]
MAAPTAHFDDEWPVLCELSGGSEQKGLAAAAPQLLLDDDDDDVGDDDHPELHDSSLSSGETGAFRSTEDLVNDLDEKLSLCFHSFNAKTDSIAPVSVIAEDALLEKDEIWSALTSSYGHVMPVDWKQSRMCFLHMSTFNLEENPTDVTAELSDDEELREQLDMHSIIVSCLAEEPLFTAEQVIEEIEEMMQDSPDMEHNPSQSDLSMLSLDIQRSASSPTYEERVRTLSVAELNERLEETEVNIRRFSEELVQQLALRDELKFEKERFSMEGLSSVIQNSFRQTFGRECNERQYLTTVIPYEKKGHPPSIEDLQILTKILQAMRDDSDKVPSLLTDYILKVICPT